MDDAFGHWLAGFIDGEGCFTIQPDKRGRTASYSCRFQVIVREDDAPIIHEIHEAAGFGWIVYRKATNNGRPQIGWAVSRKADCLLLVDLLDRFPLRAKKRGDFHHWRQAVLLWAALELRSLGDGRGVVAHDWTAMGQLAVELRACRDGAPV